MLSRSVTIADPRGLHARNAYLLSAKGETYESSIWLSSPKGRASLRSPVELMKLNLKEGDLVTVIADGIDEAEALEGTCAWLNCDGEPVASS